MKVKCFFCRKFCFYLIVTFKVQWNFCGGRGSNPGPCIYYALSVPTEISSRGQVQCNLNVVLAILPLIIYYRARNI